MKFDINGVKFDILVIDNSKYPSNIIKTKDGFKFNIIPISDINLKLNNSDYYVKKGDSKIDYTFNKNLNIKAYIDDYLLFEQNIIRNKFLPKVKLINNPLGFKLDQEYYEDVSIKIKNIDSKFTIKQGEIFVPLLLNNGLNKIIIEEYNNCIIDKLNYYIVI